MTTSGGAVARARDPGRVAGLWYLLLILFGPLRLLYIPAKLFVPGDATATSANILAHEALLRWGIVADLACAVFLVFTVLALYRLFAGFDRHLALQVAIFGGVLPAALYFVGVVADSGVLTLLHHDTVYAGFDQVQRSGLALLFLDLRDQLNTAAETLWGLWLLPLGLLVIRSRVMPRFIGYWLLVNGVAYLALSATGELAPAYAERVFGWTSVPRFGELVFMLRLVFWGAPAASRPASEGAA